MKRPFKIVTPTGTRSYGSGEAAWRQLSIYAVLPDNPTVNEYTDQMTFIDDTGTKYPVTPLLVTIRTIMRIWDISRRLLEPAQ